MAKVLLQFQDKVLKEFPIDKDIVTIGRKPGNDIHIDNLAVSGFHAKIFRDGNAFVIEDLGSLNGTFLNGAKISKNQLRNNDKVLIGKHVLSFALSEDEKSAEQAVVAKSIKADETLVLDSHTQQKFLNRMPESKIHGEGRELLGGITVIEGAAERKEYELRDRVITIGKGSDAAIRLRGLFAPKVAALINRRKEGYFINPVGGTVTKVNGSRIEERYDLKDGDIIEVGKVKMQFFIKE